MCRTDAGRGEPGNVGALLPAGTFVPASGGSVAARLLIALVRLYQKVLSPYLPPSCRFEPTCSEYAVQAVRRHGALRGAFQAARRLLRCHPFHPGGYDPVH